MPEEPQNPTTGQDADSDKEIDWKAEAEKWKNLSRKREGIDLALKKAGIDPADVKGLIADRQRLAEVEEKDKSESQKLADKATKAEKEAAEARKELARVRVAMRKGLTEAQARRLVGETEEELETDADELLSSFGAAKSSDESDTDKDKAKDDKSGRPKERLRAGAASDEEPEITDPAKLVENLPRL